MSWLKWTILISALVLGLALVGLSAVFVISWHRDEPVEVLRVSGEPSATVHIGEPVVYTMTVRLPWHRRPIREPEVVAGEGRQWLRSEPMRWLGGGLNGWLWQAKVVLQATDFMAADSPTARLFFTANRQGESQPLVVELPFPRVTPRELGAADELAIADAIAAVEEADVSASVWRWLAIGLVLLAVVAVWLAILRAKGVVGPPPPAKPPWEIAELALQRLERRLPLAPPIFFQELTDIVRDYLEDRFAIPANELTTPEFMAFVKRGDWLDERHCDMLGAFLTAADKVKFAQAEATVEQMSLALASASRLVLETRSAGAGLSVSPTETVEVAR